MSRLLVIDKGAEEGVKDLLKHLLESGKVKAVFALRKIDDSGSMAYSLITDKDKIDETVPFLPLMPNNAGKLLSHLTGNGGLKDPVAVVVRPCELRAFNELIKFEKACADNMVIISHTCGGVFPQDTGVGGKPDVVSKYWDDVKAGNITADLRPACRGCENFVPTKADMVVELVGKGDLGDKCSIYLVTDKGQEFADGMSGNVLEGELKDPAAYRGKRTEEKNKLFEQHKVGPGLKGILKTFGDCIGCKGCRSVCPICFCQLCTFDLQDSGYKSSKWECDLNGKGGLRVPPNTIYYHLGRLTHVALSCVGCGACQDVCPVDIPLAIIYKQVGESIQGVFDYLPGRAVDEEIPLKTFQTEELKEVEH
jgi:formate dehydrogenase subunit beta